MIPLIGDCMQRQENAYSIAVFINYQYG